MNTRYLLFVFACATVSCQAARSADLNQHYLRSVEWLVDHSDVIAIVCELPADGRNRTVLQTLKGDAGNLAPNLSYVPPRLGYGYFRAPSEGRCRLLFVRGSSELLESVSLARSGEPVDFPSLKDVFYGVTQYGELLLTRSALLDVVRSRLRSGPGEPVAVKESPHSYHSGITAAFDFPMETNNITYVLVVPFTRTRRDHFIAMLASGDAAARIDAIAELLRFADDTALAAIRRATTTNRVRPALGPGDATTMLSAEDVRQAASQALRGS